MSITITITMTLKEARSIEAQLKQIAEDREGFCEPVKCVQDEVDRLESVRIRITKAINAKLMS